MNINSNQLESFLDYAAEDETFLYCKVHKCFIDIEKVSEDNYAIVKYDFNSDATVLISDKLTTNQLVKWLVNSRTVVYDVNLVQETIADDVEEYDLIFLFGNNPFVVTSVQSDTDTRRFLSGKYLNGHITVEADRSEEFYGIEPTELSEYLDVSNFSDGLKAQQIKIAKPSVRKHIIEDIYKGVKKLLEQEFPVTENKTSVQNQPDVTNEPTEVNIKPIARGLTEDEVMNFFNMFFR